MQRFDEIRDAAKACISFGNDLPAGISLTEREVEVEIRGEEYEQLVLPGCEPERTEGGGHGVHREKKKVTLRLFCGSGGKQTDIWSGFSDRGSFKGIHAVCLSERHPSSGNYNRN